MSAVLCFVEGGLKCICAVGNVVAVDVAVIIRIQCCSNITFFFASTAISGCCIAMYRCMYCFPTIHNLYPMVKSQLSA